MSEKNDRDWLGEPTNEEAGRLLKRLHALTDRVLKGNVNFSWVMEAIQMLLDSKKPVPYSLLPSPAVQLGMLNILDSHFNLGVGWKIGSLKTSAPRKISTPPYLAYALCLNLNPNKLLQILIQTRDVWVSDVFKGSLNPGFYTEHNNWSILNFSPTDTRGQTIRKFREETPAEKIPGQSVLWALICNPNLLIELRKFGITSVWIPGITIDRDGQSFAITLSHDDQSGRTEVGTGNIDHGGTNWCIPKFV